MPFSIGLDYAVSVLLVCTLYVAAKYRVQSPATLLRYYIHPGPGDRGTFDPPRRTGTQVRAYCLPSCTVS
eukprot:COSAG01_NODE_8121_length_2913_cov_105.004264_5_plen_70_part_00